MLVVGDQHTAVTVRLPEQRQQGVHVLGGGAFPHHDVLSPAELFHRLGKGGTLVVRADPCGNVGVEVFAGKQGSVTVYDLTGVGAVRQLLQDARVAAHGAVGVHQLRQTQDPGVPVVGAESIGVQHCPGFVQVRCRYAGGQHKVHRKCQIPGGLQHEIQPLGPGNVGDLVGIGDNGSGAMGQHCLFKGGTAEHGAFDMDVSVYEPGAEIAALQVHLGRSGIAAYSHDPAAADRHVSLLDLVGEHVDHPGILQHQIGSCFSPCCGDLPFQHFSLHNDLLSAFFKADDGGGSPAGFP